MPIIIKNLGRTLDERGSIYRYSVKINNGPVLAVFDHEKTDGLAVCLRKAARAVEGALALQEPQKP